MVRNVAAIFVIAQLALLQNCASQAEDIDGSNGTCGATCASPPAVTSTVGQFLLQKKSSRDKIKTGKLSDDPDETEDVNVITGPVSLIGLPCNQSSSNRKDDCKHAIANKSGIFHDMFKWQSCTSTYDSPDGEWWQVRLPALHEIETLSVASLRDTVAVTVYVDDKECAADYVLEPRMTTVIPCNRSGREVKIEAEGGKFLTLCDVKVNAPTPPHAMTSSDAYRFDSTVAYKGGKVWQDREYVFTSLDGHLHEATLFEGPIRLGIGDVLSLDCGDGSGTFYALLTAGREGSFAWSLPKAGWTLQKHMKAAWTYGDFEIYSHVGCEVELPPNMAHGKDAIVTFLYVPKVMPEAAPVEEMAPAGHLNHYRKEEGTGAWGGRCTCPDGQVYEVGDNGDHCKSLACENGVSGPCGPRALDAKGAGMKVTCAGDWLNHYRKEPNVGTWGGICTCPDGMKYEVGDNHDWCGSLACENGVAGPCTAGGISHHAGGMKVTCHKV